MGRGVTAGFGPAADLEASSVRVVRNVRPVLPDGLSTGA